MKWRKLKMATDKERILMWLVNEIYRKALYSHDAIESWKKIQPSVQRLQAMGIKVMVLGIYPGKVKPLWFVETMNTLMCSIHEFGITGIPKGQKIEDFLNEELDILINCDMQEQFTTNYVSMLSPAGFKVAIDTDKTRKHFDLLIKLENPQLGAFIEQTMFYLSSFKTKI
jgi:hypothetical protein